MFMEAGKPTSSVSFEKLFSQGIMIYFNNPLCKELDATGVWKVSVRTGRSRCWNIQNWAWRLSCTSPQQIPALDSPGGYIPTRFKHIKAYLDRKSNGFDVYC